MYVVMNRLFVASDHIEQFEKRFLSRSGMVDTMPGFVRNQILRPTKEGNPYIILTYWQSQEEFDAWTESDAFKQAHSGGGEATHHIYTAPNHVETFMVIADTQQDV